MLIQIHLLQNHAPSNLNRDDTGSPKDAVFGGFRRGRISSQCLKRSIRHSQAFAEAFAADGLLARRTLLLPKLVDERLTALGVAEPIRKAIVGRLPEMGKRESKGEKGEKGDAEAEADTALKTRILVFLTDVEAAIVADKLWELYQAQGDKAFAKMPIADIEKSLAHATPRSVDVAMFGRMTTSAAFENVEAAVQVAHALSTNSLDREFDYFTAVDDISGESGASMIGDVEFNSSTYYKYFNVHWEQLVSNLGGDQAIAVRAINALIEAAATTQPSGKQNGFAANNPPDFILVEISPSNVPVSYANAFLTPVRADAGGSLMLKSITALDHYSARLRAAYNLNGQRAFLSVEDGASLSQALSQPSLNDLQAWTAQTITGVAHA